MLLLYFLFITLALFDSIHCEHGGRARFHRSTDENRIQGRYIILVKEGVDALPDLARVLVNDNDDNTKPELEAVIISQLESIGAITAVLSEAELDKVISLDYVQSVEEDRSVSIDSAVDIWEKNARAVESMQVVRRRREVGDDWERDNKLPSPTSTDSWALDRVNQRTLPLDRKFSSVSGNTEDIDVYVVDTGVDIYHPGFQGRANHFYSYNRSDSSDGNGHGTHVAGLISGRNWGVSKATVHSVKVIPAEGKGPVSFVLEGINSILTRRVTTRRAIMSMSLHEKGDSPSLRRIIETLVTNNVVVVNAAGNTLPEGDDACSTAPAAFGNTITVGAINNNDELSSYSNYGRCVDILAPGDDVISLWPHDQTMSLTGTSQACPLVVGAVANYLSLNMAATPQEVKEAIQVTATLGKINLRKHTNTPNRILNVLFQSNEVTNASKVVTADATTPTRTISMISETGTAFSSVIMTPRSTTSTLASALTSGFEVQSPTTTVTKIIFSVQTVTTTNTVTQPKITSLTRDRTVTTTVTSTSFFRQPQATVTVTVTPNATSTFTPTAGPLNSSQNPNQCPSTNDFPITKFNSTFCIPSVIFLNERMTDWKLKTTLPAESVKMRTLPDKSYQVALPDLSDRTSYRYFDVQLVRPVSRLMPGEYRLSIVVKALSEKIDNEEIRLFTDTDEPDFILPNPVRTVSTLGSQWAVYHYSFIVPAKGMVLRSTLQLGRTKKIAVCGATLAYCMPESAP